MARRRRLKQLTLYRDENDDIVSVMAHIEVIVTDPGPPVREGIDYEFTEMRWANMPTSLKQALAGAQSETLSYVEELDPLDKVRSSTEVGTSAVLL
jgi:hypothetical protein